MPTQRTPSSSSDHDGLFIPRPNTGWEELSVARYNPARPIRLAENTNVPVPGWSPDDPLITDDGTLIQYFEEEVAIASGAHPVDFEVSWASLWPRIAGESDAPPGGVGSPGEAGSGLTLYRRPTITGFSAHIKVARCWVLIALSLKFTALEQVWACENGHWTRSDSPTNEEFELHRTSKFNVCREPAIEP